MASSVKTPSRFAALAMPATMTAKRVLDIVMRLLTETDTTATEFVSSSTLLYVGLLLALPGALLDQTIPLFHAMTSFMGESAWAIIFFAFGAFQAVANLSRSKGARRYAAFCCGLLFGFIGLLGASVHPISLMGAFCKVHAFGQAVVYLHLGTREK